MVREEEPLATFFVWLQGESRVAGTNVPRPRDARVPFHARYLGRYLGK